MLTLYKLPVQTSIVKMAIVNLCNYGDFLKTLCTCNEYTVCTVLLEKHAYLTYHRFLLILFVSW